jgi:hypothetical protein
MTLVHLVSANLFVLASAKEFVAVRKHVRPLESRLAETKVGVRFDGLMFRRFDGLTCSRLA